MPLLKALLLNAGCISLALASPLTLTNSLPSEFNTIPQADTSIDRSALSNLVPSKQVNLKYHDTTDPAGYLTLNIAADLISPAVVLENSIFIEQVHCSPSHNAISVHITDPTARTRFLSALSRSKNGAALITKSKTCNADSERGFFRQNGPAKSTSSDGVVTIPVLQKDLNSISKKLDVNYEYIPEDPASQGDLQRRAVATPSPCKLNSGSAIASLQCNATGNLKAPTKTKFQTANDLNSCMQLCEKDATCMSFGFAKGLPAGQSCWTSVVSLTKQKFVLNKSSPWQLYDRGCYTCSFPATSSTKSSSTKTTSTSTSTVKTTSTSASTIKTTSTATVRVSSSQSTTVSSTSKSTSSSLSQSSSASTSKTTSLSSSSSTVISSTTTLSTATISSTTTSTITSSSAAVAAQSSLPLAGNGWQTDSNILPTASEIPLVYNSQAAVASYTKLLKNLVYSSGTVQGSYVPASTATAPAITFNPNDAGAQASIVAQLMSIGLQGPDAALSSVAAQATFAPPNIPANSPDPGQDELGGGSVLPTQFPGSAPSKRSIDQVQAPKLAVVAAPATNFTKRSIVPISPSELPAPRSAAVAVPVTAPQLLVRDGGDDFCDGVEVADDVCDALEGLEQPAVEIGCGVVGLVNFGCEIRESWDALKCLFGGDCPGPAPPPPPIALTYNPKATQFSWSQPVNQTMWTDGTATVYCAQCSLDISNLGFSGTITIDPTSKGIEAGNIVMSESSQRWLVLGLTTTGPSSGQKTFSIATPPISTISVGSIFSITPSFAATFGLAWGVNNAYKDMQEAGAQIGQFGSQIFSDFYTKATQDQGEAKPGMRTFRPGLKPGDWMQTYAGTSASIDYKTAGQTLPGYVNTYIEYAIQFNAQPSSSCGSSTTGIAKQAYVTVHEDTYIGGTHTNLFSVSKQLADQCGVIGAASPNPDGCGNGGAQWALFDMNKIAGSSIGNLYTIVPSEQGVIDFIGGFDTSVRGGDVSQGQSEGTTMDLSSYGNGNGFPYYQRILVTQGYMYAPVSGTYTFQLNVNDQAGNFATWAFWGPPNDPGIENFGASAYIAIDSGEETGHTYSTSPTLYMAQGSYYAYRMIIQVVQAYHDSSVSYHWQVNYPNGTTWLSNNDHGDHNLVQYSCDQTTAPPFPDWAEF